MHQTRERQLPDEELGALLDLTKGNSSGPVMVGLLDTSCSRGQTCEQP